MKKIENNISNVSEKKFYAGEHENGNLAIISRDDYETGIFRSKILGKGFTEGDGWVDGETLKECIKNNSLITWYEFESFKEICIWYLKKVS